MHLDWQIFNIFVAGLGESSLTTRQPLTTAEQ